jgi:two-component system cell cycle response regulator DivK
MAISGMESAREKRPNAVDPEAAAVLVVEDNAANFALVARLLAYAGVSAFEWKTTGWHVADFAEKMARVDLILMDLKLPHEDGYGALQSIRQHPRLRHVPVVVVTASVSGDEMKKAREAGFDGYIAKPLNAERFPKQIARILKGEEVWDLGHM